MIKAMKIALCFAIFLSFSLTPLYAADYFSLKKFKNIYGGFGTWQEYYMQTQGHEDGSLNTFEFTPFFTAGVDYQITPEHLIIPEIGYVYRQEISGGAVTKDHFFLRFDYAYTALEWLRLRVGTSFMWVWYNGDGSERTFPNGSSTEVYYAPEESSHTLNQTLDFGVEFIKKQFSFRVGSYIYAANEQNERLTSFSMAINYIIGLDKIWKR